MAGWHSQTAPYVGNGNELIDPGYKGGSVYLSFYGEDRLWTDPILRPGFASRTDHRPQG